MRWESSNYINILMVDGIEQENEGKSLFFFLGGGWWIAARLQ